jgi:hypothetical protein
MLALLACARASAQTRLGPEFQLNTYETHQQQRPRVAMHADGSFVVVWSDRSETFMSPGRDGSGAGIFGQRFDANGVRVGPDFQVNTYTTGYQSIADVAGDGAGGFVVVWTDSARDGSQEGIFGQRFDATGARLGGEFQVNTWTTSIQISPRVTAHPNGFIVVWESRFGQDGSSTGVFGQRFDASGARLGGEFLVNTDTFLTQNWPRIAGDGTGAFVVVWESLATTPGFFGQRFDAAGARLGGQFPIDVDVPFTSNRLPDVAMVPDGRFLVVWARSKYGVQSEGIRGQLFAAGGAPVGSEFVVSTNTDDSQGPVAVAASAAGFVVVWTNEVRDGLVQARGVFGQALDPDGQRVGAEFRASLHTVGATSGAVRVRDDGEFVVVWDIISNYRAPELYGQRFNPTTPPERAGRMLDFHADAVADLLWYNGVSGQPYLWRMSAGHAVSFLPLPTVADLDWSIVAGGDFGGDGRADLVWYNRTSRQVFLWQMNGATPIATHPVAVAAVDWEIQASGDTDGDGRADLVWRNRASGEVQVWRMNGAAVLSAASAGTVGDLEQRIVAVRDFTGDGRADLLWRHRVTGQVLIWRMNGATTTAVIPVITQSLDWKIVGAADGNGDGTSDIYLHNQATGQVSLWTMSLGTIAAATRVATVADLQWRIVSAGDFNGNGRADLLWQNTTTGQVYAWLMNGAAILVSTHVATVPDFNWGLSLLY